MDKAINAAAATATEIIEADLAWAPSSGFLRQLAGQVPHIEQYFGVWAIYEEVFRGMVDQANRLDLRVHVQQHEGAELQQASANREYGVTTGGVAVLEARGTLMKYTSSMSANTSTIALRRQVRQAVRDEDVSAILLRIDSPGGTVYGTYDLVDDIREAAKQKSVYAYIEDLGASAAYAVASVATKIFSNPSALVGSIGTFSVLQDMSGAAAQLGIKVHVIRAGKHKGAGVPGTEVTAEHLADAQRIVDQMNAFFLQTIENGRKIPRAKVESIADGRVWVAGEAKEMGLIDGVQSLDATLNQLTNLSKQRSRSTMSSETKPIVAELAQTTAGVDDIRRACQGATADFILSQLERKATVEQAMQAWIGEQQKAIVIAQEEAKQAVASAKKPGVEALAGKAKSPASAATDSYDGDPRSDFDAKVRERMASGQGRMAAIQAVARQNPALHEAFLLATNPNRKQQALIRDRFASVN
jgi:signal peptide peptidase SppA